MLEKVRELFNSAGYTEFNGAEQEALLAALIFTKFADGSIMLKEDETIDSMLEGLEWRSETSFRVFLSDTTARIREAYRDDAGTDAYLTELKDKLYGEDTGQMIYDACFQVATADDNIHKKEMAFLQRIKAIWGLG